MELYPSLSETYFVHLPLIMRELDAYVNGYHIDIMDFNFVPNFSWSPALVNIISTYTQKPLWLHFMVTHPEKLLPFYVQYQHKYIISIHQESILNWSYVNKLKKQAHISLGLAISPSTSLAKIVPYLDNIEHLLIMSVQPGFSGQQFLSNTWARIEQAYELCRMLEKSCMIAVDGGVTVEHIDKLRNHKVEMIAASSAIFPAYRIDQYDIRALPHEFDFDFFIQQSIDNIKKLKAV